MLIVSTPNLENQKIKEYLGIVTGSTVRARNVGSDILANLKNLVGGELISYSRLLEGAREEALSRMICLLYTSPSPRDRSLSRMPSSA